MILFNEKEHKYFNEDGEEYISVTTLIGNYLPFHKQAIIKNVTSNPKSEYYEMSTKEVSDQWNQTAVVGNSIHKAIEEYIQEGTLSIDFDIQPNLDQFRKLNFSGDLLTEQRIWNDEYKIAGTVDIIEQCDDVNWIWDIKTCKKLDHHRQLKFGIQLEMYRKFVEDLYKKRTLIGGIIFFENYFKLRDECKMTVVKVSKYDDWVKEILDKRKADLCK